MSTDSLKTKYFFLDCMHVVIFRTGYPALYDWQYCTRCRGYRIVAFRTWHIRGVNGKPLEEVYKDAREAADWVQRVGRDRLGNYVS